METVQIINKKTLETMFHRYYEPLCRYAFSILKQQETAEEVVQELFVHLWEKRCDTSITSDVRAYLYRSVYHASLNSIKSKARRPAMIDIDTSPESKSFDMPGNILAGNELEKQIENAINKLPEKCALVFKLSRFEQLSYKEIADKMQISLKTVENHMGKALQHMRIALKDYLPIFIISLILWKA